MSYSQIHEAVRLQDAPKSGCMGLARVAPAAFPVCQRQRAPTTVILKIQYILSYRVVVSIAARIVGRNKINLTMKISVIRTARCP